MTYNMRHVPTQIKFMIKLIVLAILLNNFFYNLVSRELLWPGTSFVRYGILGISFTYKTDICSIYLRLDIYQCKQLRLLFHLKLFHDKVIFIKKYTCYMINYAEWQF